MQDLATVVNHQIRLAARPVGMPRDSDWQFTTEPAIRRAGRQFVETERSWKTSVARYADVYAALTKRQ